MSKGMLFFLCFVCVNICVYYVSYVYFMIIFGLKDVKRLAWLVERKGNLYNFAIEKINYANKKTPLYRGFEISKRELLITLMSSEQ